MVVRYRPLNISAAIDDYRRGVANEGDGKSLGSGFGVFEGSTNLVTNGGFETNTTGWAASGTNTIERVGGIKFGSYILKCTYQNNTILGSYAITLTAAIHSLSIWVYVPTAYDGTAPRVRFTGFTSATGTIFTAIDLSLRDQWQRVRVPGITIDAGDLVGTLDVFENGTAPTAGRFIYIDGVQCEQKSFCTPYIETDGGTAARTAARVQAIAQDVLNAAQGWVALRIVSGWANANEPAGNCYLFSWKYDSTNYINIYYAVATNEIYAERRSAAGIVTVSAAKTLAIDEAMILIIAWTSSSILCSINGAAFTLASGANIPLASLMAGSVIDIGSAAGATQLNGIVRWLATGIGTLTNADAVWINALGVVCPDFAMFRNENQARMLWDTKAALTKVQV